MLFFNKAQQDLQDLKKNIKKTLLYLSNRVASGMITINKTYCFVLSSRYGIIDNIESYSAVNSIVTTYDDYRQSSVSSSDISINGIYKSIDKSVNISKYTEKDYFFGLPDFCWLFNHTRTINLFFPYIFSVKEIIHLVNITDSAALNFNSKITNTEGSVFECFININVLGNSLGWIGTYLSTYYCLSSCVIASNNISMEKDSFYTVSRDFNDLDNPVFVGQNSAKKSIAKLNSKKISTCVSPVIFFSDISCEIFGYLINAITGYSIYRKSTFLLNYLNKKIFPDWLSIWENPFLEKGLSSRLFDNEGVTTILKKIIDNGILKTWLLDTYSANKLNMYSTGHAGGITNWIVSTNRISKSFDQLVFSMHQGILITELLGDGFNVMTGNFSCGVCGFWVANGKIQFPVNEITISGNLIDIWKNISEVSDDINKKNIIQSASILVNKIQISGN